MAGIQEGQEAGEGEEGVVQALFDEVVRLQADLEEAKETVEELTLELNAATGLRCDFAASAAHALEQLACAVGAADDEGTKQWEQVMVNLAEARAEVAKSKARCDNIFDSWMYSIASNPPLPGSATHPTPECVCESFGEANLIPVPFAGATSSRPSTRR